MGYLLNDGITGRTFSFLTEVVLVIGIRLHLLQIDILHDLHCHFPVVRVSWPSSEPQLIQWAGCCRDIKPENVLLQGGQSDGKVFLVDLGGVQVSII